MEVKVITMSRPDEIFIRDAVKYYESKLMHYTRFSSVELSISAGKSASQIDIDNEKILKQVQQGDLLYILDDKGKKYSSTGFSKLIEKNNIYNTGAMIFCIGGAYGVSDMVKKMAHGQISFSDMTFNHQLFRVMLLEQLYRAFTIIKGEKYHHG